LNETRLKTNTETFKYYYSDFTNREQHATRKKVKDLHCKQKCGASGGESLKTRENTHEKKRTIFYECEESTETMGKRLFFLIFFNDKIRGK